MAHSFPPNLNFRRPYCLSVGLAARLHRFAGLGFARQSVWWNPVLLCAAVIVRLQRQRCDFLSRARNPGFAACFLRLLVHYLSAATGFVMVAILAPDGNRFRRTRRTRV